MLDLAIDRQGPPPRDAATLLVVRNVPEGAAGRGGGIEVFCVERHKKSGFLGGAIVFPGGKVDDVDREEAWADPEAEPDDPRMRAHKIAACREALEEAAILPVTGGVITHDDLITVRADLLATRTTLRTFLTARGLRLDLGALRPFARWVTPLAEARRFDTLFFVAAAPPGQRGAHDERETTSSFWARPADVIARFIAGEVQLAPPTHRTLELFADASDAADVMARAASLSLAPICPRMVKQIDRGTETIALVLPGDPEHDERTQVVPGQSRYVLRGDRFLPEDAPPR